jgi:GTP-binding protein
MSETADHTDAEAAQAAQAAEVVEAARLLFARPWRFVTSVPTMAALPPATGVEVAFAGRSNVGKSSLLNALTGQKALAKSSNTPGRTRLLNFFVAEPDAGLTLVDMPGYGYARAPKTEVAAWTRLVFDFLRGRPNLVRVYLLIDARHGLKPIDAEAMAALDEAAVSYQAVLTKADKIKPPAIARLLADTAAALARRPAAHPEVLATSATGRLGLDELRTAIAGVVPDR